MQAATQQFFALVALLALLNPAFAQAPRPRPQSAFRPDSPVLRMAGIQTRLVQHQATKRQREVAEARARAYVEAYRRKIAKAQAATKPSPPSKTATKTATKTKKVEPPGEPKQAKKSTKPKTTVAKKTTPETEPPQVVPPKKAAPPEPKVATQPEPKVVAQPKPLPRYIAVDTVKDERTSPKAKKAVMIWDTQVERIVGNNVYDVEKPPPVGEAMKFDTYSAQYIGAGL